MENSDFGDDSLTASVEIVEEASVGIVEETAETRTDCNGRSSPDSGINDLTDDHNTPSPVSPDERFEQKVTIMPNAVLNIKIGDTVRQIEGK
ncbi:MAG: hypothetical protein AAGD00_07695 [Planctomycetota bacterium]